MRVEDKTKEQLMDELVKLRRRVTELESETSEAKRDKVKDSSRVKIGEILIEMGCLTRPQLSEALQKQKEASALGHKHMYLGRILVESGIITPEELDRGVATQLARLRHQFNQ